MALMKCPECGKEVSDRASACIHCGFPLSDVKSTVGVSNEKREHRLVIESIPEGSPKQDPAIDIIRDITGMTYEEAKDLVEQRVVIVKNDISLAEAKELAARFKSIDVNASTYHNTVPLSWEVMTMEKKRADDEFMKNWRERDKRRDAEIKKAEEQKFHQYEHEMRQRQQEIDNYDKPKKPNFIVTLFSGNLFWASCLILIGPTIAFLFCGLAGIEPDILILYIALGYLATPVWLFIGYLIYKDEVKLYKDELALYKTNPEEWKLKKEHKKKMIEEEYRSRAHNEVVAEYGPKPQSQASKLACPVCGSNNVERITTVDRSVSVAVVGLASGKIGKQYKCKQCKHMW